MADKNTPAAGPGGATQTAGREDPGQDPVRIMVVDDSAVIRHFISRYIESDPGLKVVSSVANGEMAVSSVKRNDIDVVVLDIEMPVMDGLTALPLLLEARPGVKVIVASTLTQRGASETVRALTLGASECMAKPSSAQDLNNAERFQQEIVAKAKALGRAARREKARGAGQGDAPAADGPAAQGASQNPQPKYAHLKSGDDITLNRQAHSGRPEAIAVGASTGGPQALVGFLSRLSAPLPQPIFITQHMPALFTKYLAEQITRDTCLDCREAEDGETVVNGKAYVAPGNYHMTVVEDGPRKVIRLNQDPPENFCRPSVDPMLRSLTKIYGNKLICVILTGMGQDGFEAARQLVTRGGAVIAQNRDTSVVWGMPGAVAKAGLCSAVLPLPDIGKAVETWARKVS